MYGRRLYIRNDEIQVMPKIMHTLDVAGLNALVYYCDNKTIRIDFKRGGDMNLFKLNLSLKDSHYKAGFDIVYKLEQENVS